MQGRLEVPARLAAVCMFPAFLAPNYTRSELLQHIFPTSSLSAFTTQQGQQPVTLVPRGGTNRWHCPSTEHGLARLTPDVILGLLSGSLGLNHPMPAVTLQLDGWSALSPTISSTEEASAFCKPHNSTPSSSHGPVHTSQDISLHTFEMSDKLRTQVFVSLLTTGHLHLKINKSKKKLGPTCSCCKSACTV